MRIELPVANGLRTDHPVPSLPFVDDSHVPIHDGRAIEANGRHDYNTGWGRYDRDQTDERRWSAFTNDQFNLTFRWLVRHDPGYGRTVLLYVRGDEAIMHEVTPREGDPLLHRAGGYWWDGKSWYRPKVISDAATEDDVKVRVPGARSIPAAEYMTTYPGSPDKGGLADITTFVQGEVSRKQWAHDLARWAASRPDDGLPLDQCIVDVSAAELNEDVLLSESAAAREIGLAREKIRQALNAVGGGRAERFPFPQSYTPHTKSPRWSKPVLREWNWERHRAHPEPVVEHLRREQPLPGTDALLYTLESAALWQMQKTFDSQTDSCSLGLPLENAIGWIVTEKPKLAEPLFGHIVRSARRDLELSDKTIFNALRDAVHWGTPDDADEEALDEFLRRTLPPGLSR